MHPLDNVFNIGDFAAVQFELWALAMIRISIVVFMLPLFSISQVPTQVKAGITFFVSLIIFPTLPDQQIEVPLTLVEFFLAALKELYVGMVMGFGFVFVFIGLRLAGRWMDQETGFSVSQLFNPLTEEQETSLGQFLYIIFGLLFLTTGLYLYYLQLIGESFRVIPLMSAKWALDDILQVFMILTQQSFVLGLRIAAPVVVVIFLSSLALGVVARIMPQMNVWLVGMPLKIGLGVMVLTFLLPVLWSIFLKEHDLMLNYQGALLRAMGG